MNIDLPDIVASYFAAENAKDSEQLSQCFHDDALVRDEGHDYRGVAAIKAWHRDANKTYRYEVEPLDGFVSGSTVVVRTCVTGDFPGNVAHLRCKFTLAEDRITSFEVAP
jgi:hypothetical protein